MRIVRGRVHRLLVALFTRAWIEIFNNIIVAEDGTVALFTRAWIEMAFQQLLPLFYPRRPLHEGVD